MIIKVLKFIKKKFYCKNTEKLFKMARKNPVKSVKVSPYSLVHIQKPTYTICEQAVKRDGICLRDVPWWYRDYNLCVQALEQNGKSWTYIPNNIKAEIMIVM